MELCRTASCRIEKTTVLSVSLLRHSAEILSPVLANIALEFADVPQMWIQMLLTVCTISLIPALLLANPLVRAMSLKKASIVAVALTIVGGIMPFFVRTFWLLILSRIIIGFGVGLLNPISASLITQRYADEEKKRLIGGRTAVASLGTVVLGLIGGSLTQFGWRYLTLAYFIGIPIILLLIFFLPEKSSGAPSPPKARERKGLHMPGKPLVGITLVIFLYSLFLGVYQTNVSMLVGQEGIGDASVVSILTAMSKFSAFLSGLVFVKVTGLLKRWCMGTCVAATAAAFFMLAAGRSLVMFALGSFLSGFAMGVVLAIGILRSSEFASGENDTAAISFLTAGMNLGQFVSPLIMTPLFSALFAGSSRGAYILGGGGLALLAAILLAGNALGHTKEKRLEIRR